MQCPYCQSPSADRVVDSREIECGRVIRRRRHCTVCGKRFTTYERLEEEHVRLMVVKKDGTRMPYDRQKVVQGMARACYKQPVSAEQINRLADEVEDLLRGSEGEVSSRTIGQLVADRLRAVNHVAYVRFASVYREFKDLDDLLQEIHSLSEQTTSPRRSPRTGLVRADDTAHAADHTDSAHAEAMDAANAAEHADV